MARTAAEGRRPAGSGLDLAYVSERKRHNRSNWTSEQREANRQRQRRWREKNGDKIRAIRRKMRAKRRDFFLRKDKNGFLKRTYGITIERYDEMLREQDGKCAICKRPPPQKKSLHVDHCHETGKVRGLLCFACNSRVEYYDLYRDGFEDYYDRYCRETVTDASKHAVRRVS